MNKTKLYHYTIRFVFVCTVFLTGCSGVSSDINEFFKEGTYLVSGYQIEMEKCYPQDCGIISRDTTFIEFYFEIRNPPHVSYKDTVQVVGLEGVNGDNLYICYPRYNLSCSLAKYKNGKLEINIMEPAGSYLGTGKLNKSGITLEATYFRRGVQIDYKLEGHIVSF